MPDLAEVARTLDIPSEARFPNIYHPRGIGQALAELPFPLSYGSANISQDGKNRLKIPFYHVHQCSSLMKPFDELPGMIKLLLVYLG